MNLSDEFNAWMADFVNLRTKNGESYIDLYAITQRFLNFLLEENHEKVGVVCHAGFKGVK